MTSKFSLILALFLISILSGHGFNSIKSVSTARKSLISMGYIPDGLTKAQWEAIQKKEADEKKVK